MLGHHSPPLTTIPVLGLHSLPRQANPTGRNPFNVSSHPVESSQNVALYEILHQPNRKQMLHRIKLRKENVISQPADNSRNDQEWTSLLSRVLSSKLYPETIQLSLY